MYIVHEEFLNDVLFREIVLLENGLYEVKTLNCLDSKVLGLGDCECRDHPTYSVMTNVTDYTVKRITGIRRFV